MEEMNEKRLQKTYNTAIFVAFVVGFLFHAAIIFAGGIGWSQITKEGQKLNEKITQDGKDLRDRIAALEKLCKVPQSVAIEKKIITDHNKREVISSSVAKPDVQRLLLLQLQDKVSNLQHQYQVKDSDVQEEITAQAAELRQEMKSESAKLQTQLGYVRQQVQKISSSIISYHSNKADVKCPAGYKLNPYRGTCVRFVRMRKNWFDAKMYCERKGEFLATFDTVESASWYRQQQLTAGWTGDSWIGGRRQSDRTEYRWYGINTGAVSISYWAVGESNDGDGLCIDTHPTLHYYWDGNNCAHHRFYMCKQKTVLI